MQEFNAIKIGLYVSVFNALPNKDKFHIYGDEIVGDNKSIVITPNEEPGMTGRVDITLTCALTNVQVTETQLVYMQTTDSQLIVGSLMCKYMEALVTASQNTLSHMRTLFDTAFIREEDVVRDEWFIDNFSNVTMNLSEDMCFINFVITRKDERSIVTNQTIQLPLYRITPDSVVNYVIPTIQALAII